MDFKEYEKYQENLIQEWEKKVTPVPQFSEKVKILQIRYYEEEKRIMGIFRAVVLSKEVSLKVYELTSLVIDIAPTNYVAWVLRRECLDKVKEIDPQQELYWLDSIMIQFQKNYQIWHHRKLLIEKMNDVSHEKPILDSVFQYEPKNFHAWTHRIWMIRRFNNVENEFDFIEFMLKNDIKNNSVWNYRFFLVQFTNNNKLNKDIVEKEIKYALEKIQKNPINECPYCYIRGLINKCGFKYSDFNFVKNELEKIVEKNENDYYGLSLLLDYYEEEENNEKFDETIEKLIRVDFIRKKYYLWRKKNSVFNKNKE